MTRLEFTLRELGELYEFYKAIRPYRIKSDRSSSQVEEERLKNPEMSETRLSEASPPPTHGLTLSDTADKT